MPAHRDPTQHRKPLAIAARDRQPDPARDRPGRAGVTEGLQYRRSWVTPVEEGASIQDPGREGGPRPGDRR
jgi:hypothetical protein